MDKYLGQMNRQTWIAAAIGFVVGLLIGWFAIGWGVWPVEWTDASFEQLRPDLRRDYLVLAIQSYARDPNTGLAAQRWAEIGPTASNVLAEVNTNPQAFGLQPQEVNNFAAAVNAAPGQVGDGTTTPAGSGFPLPLLIFSCLLTLLIAGLLVYLLLFRNRQPAMARAKVGSGGAAAVSGAPQPVATYPEGQEPPIAQYLTTYALGNDLYDDSFSIDSPSGEFLGECGVGISETIGVGDPKKVTAFEVWLFD